MTSTAKATSLSVRRARRQKIFCAEKTCAISRFTRPLQSPSGHGTERNRALRLPQKAPAPHACRQQKSSRVAHRPRVSCTKRGRTRRAPHLQEVLGADPLSSPASLRSRTERGRLRLTARGHPRARGSALRAYKQDTLYGVGGLTAGARGVPRNERSEFWGFRANPRPTMNPHPRVTN